MRECRRTDFTASWVEFCLSCFYMCQRSRLEVDLAHPSGLMGNHGLHTPRGGSAIPWCRAGTRQIGRIVQGALKPPPTSERTCPIPLTQRHPLYYPSPPPSSASSEVRHCLREKSSDTLGEWKLCAQPSEAPLSNLLYATCAILTWEYDQSR